MNRTMLQFLRFVAIVGFFLSSAVCTTTIVNTAHNLVQKYYLGNQVTPFGFEWQQILLHMSLGLIPIAPFAILYLYCCQLLKRDRES